MQSESQCELISGASLVDAIWSWLQQFSESLLQDLLDPNKRTSVYYLLSALILALTWSAFAQRKSLQEALQSLFSSSVWLSPSARADYCIWLLNSVLMLLVAPVILGQLTVAYWLFEKLHIWFPIRSAVPDLEGWHILLFGTLVHVILDDFARFYLHRLLHRVPFLWSFHKVHHSARVLTPFTVFRSHPVEMLLFSMRSSIVQGTSMALLIYLFGDKADLATVFGVGVVTFVFNLLGANLRHSHIPIGYGRRVEAWLMSPAQHQIHHSTDPDHFDKNFGVILSIWDRMLGSHCYSVKNQKIRFGLTRQSIAGEQQLTRLYLAPLIEAISGMKRLLLKMGKRLSGS